MIRDEGQRQKATDPSRSFIVQAPAGSGKTELLTQRYLRLLGKVSAPEHIVALTFTRKAASEMRERILFALKQVADDKKPLTPHQQQTFDYAKKALLRSKQFNWQLNQQPNRLRVMTIDALCQSITHAIPLKEKQIPYAQITDNPLTYYQLAARSCLEQALALETMRPALKRLLHHVDNRLDKLLDSFANMLASREQWLPVLFQAKRQSLTCFNSLLQSIEQQALVKLNQSFPKETKEKLCLLAQALAEIEADPQSPRYKLRDCFPDKPINRDLANSLANLIFTADNSVRQSFDHHVGLKRGACEEEHYHYLKAESKALLTQLSQEAAFLDSLLKLKNLPPAQYDPEQEQILQDLLTLLPLLVSHLQWIFGENNTQDFTAISQQALYALGDEENPTDLALYLDYSIHHLLIDEFQDTSLLQFQLISQLTLGWQENEGKTLFLVGDPMQSIYRFRQAEVGLFLKAKLEGIGPLKLEFLELTCNFRSTTTLVNWINQHFQQIFPKQNSLELGGISFHPSFALKDKEESSIQAYQYGNRQQQAEAIVNCALYQLENYPEENLAILVRSRNQLSAIIQLLRKQHVSFQGIEIEYLSELPHLRDIWSLTQALLLPANRLAWLALLRSPFCGLPLAELHLLANFDNKKSIFYALSQLDHLALSEESRTRLRYFYQVMQNAFACRHQESLVDWIINTFKQLHGELILDVEQQADLEQFWLLLESLTLNQQYPNLEQFKNAFNQLYSKRTQTSRLHVMTIHKSKGLEFDCVIIPELSAKIQNKAQPLLRWSKLPEAILITPIKSAFQERCPVYNYLTQLEAEKDNFELQRLLYVAVTRAKKRLFLFDQGERVTKNCFRNFLKQQEFIICKTETNHLESKTTLPLRYQLPLDYYSNPPPSNPFTKGASLDFNLPNSLALQIGIVTHELLQWICTNHPHLLQEIPWFLVANRFKAMGFEEEALNEACLCVTQQITSLFHDPIGQWIVQKHSEEVTEYALIINQGPSIQIVDRSFIDQGYRWIIDFKTGSQTLSNDQSYRQQVNGYAALFAKKALHPIRCGIYYLNTNTWIHWDYMHENLNSEAI